MDATFNGFAIRTDLPFRLVSLSGGGYRAALFHAGVLRALHAAGEIDSDRFRVAINAVSGGVVPAMLWRAFLSSYREDELWPERAILDLVTRGPGFPRFGRVGLFVAARWFRNAWYRHVQAWWQQHRRALTSPEGIATDEALVTCELVDFESAEIWALHRGLLIAPDEQLFKYGEPSRALHVHGEAQPVTPAEVILRATAFPIFFAPWEFTVDRGAVNAPLLEGRYHLIDAGLVDNLALLPLLPLVTSETLWTPQSRQGSTWYISDAGAPMAFRDEGRHLLQLGRRTARTTAQDRALRLFGDIGQRLLFGAMDRLIRSQRLVDRFVPFTADTVPEPTPSDADGEEYRERPWCVSRMLKTPADVATLPTSLAPMKRDDALAVLMHGAQLASTFSGLAPTARPALRRLLMQLA